MKYIYLLIFTLFYLTSSKSCTLEEALNKSTRQQPVAQRILDATENLPEDQETKPLKKKNRPSEPNSPGHTIDKVIRERQAIQDFVLYLRAHIAHSTKEDVGFTPLNTHTVLKAAVRKISVGDEMHFQRVVFYNPYAKSTDDDHTQAILQIDIDPNLKDEKGRTNIERMRLGKSPIGPDRRRINLHHVNQKDGLLMELFGSTHTRLSRYLHYRRGYPSLIDRNEFALFRNAYWKWRGETLEELLKEDNNIKRKFRLATQALEAQAAAPEAASSSAQPCPPSPASVSASPATPSNSPTTRKVIKATRKLDSLRDMR